MAELWQTLIYYFQFPLVQYALIVSLLIALCSSLLGVTLVLKRFSFIGDGLSHVAFGAMAVSASLHTVITIENDMILVLPITVLSAIFLLRTSQNAKIKGDALIAMISVGALAIGYLLMNLFSNSANISGDVCTTLFGATSILTLTISEVWLCAIMALLVIIIFILFYHKIFAVTFDENFATATGVNANAYNLLIAIITALIIVLAMNLVGSLLISALIIFPSLSAMRIFKSFQSVIICSSIISVICAGMGIILSILYSTPAGATIVVADIAVFLLFSLVSCFMTKRAHA
ncbi:MAG: metal ABC transporter permease [Oscillospiraceae bacterium]|nr:metal ABC transporter permease [Oscillospiraceae bacterium]